MGSGPNNGLTKIYTRANGAKIYKMELDNLLDRMETSMKVNFKMGI